MDCSEVQDQVRIKDHGEFNFLPYIYYRWSTCLQCSAQRGVIKVKIYIFKFLTNTNASYHLYSKRNFSLGKKIKINESIALNLFNHQMGFWLLVVKIGLIHKFIYTAPAAHTGSLWLDLFQSYRNIVFAEIWHLTCQKGHTSS